MALLITASAGVAKVISMDSGAISTGQSLPQFMMPSAEGVKRTVAYSPGSMTSTCVGSLDELGSDCLRFDSTAALIRQLDGDSSSVIRWCTLP